MRGRDGDGDGRYNESNRRGRSRDSYDGRSYEYSRERGYSGHDEDIDRFKKMMHDAVNQL